MAGITTYTEEMGDAICERIAEGESLRKICEDEGMPSRMTVFRWLEANEVFCDQYARARVWQAETLMDEILDIADDATRDVVEITYGEGEDATTSERERFTAAARDKLKIDSRKWLMGQLAPKKYGPKMTLAVKDENPIQSLSDEELLDELRKLAPPQ